MRYDTPIGGAVVQMTLKTKLTADLASNFQLSIVVWQSDILTQAITMIHLTRNALRTALYPALRVWRQSDTDEILFA
jgi:hypothetical protein